MSPTRGNRALSDEEKAKIIVIYRGKCLTTAIGTPNEGRPPDAGIDTLLVNAGDPS